MARHIHSVVGHTVVLADTAADIAFVVVETEAVVAAAAAAAL